MNKTKKVKLAEESSKKHKGSVWIREGMCEDLREWMCEDV